MEMDSTTVGSSTGEPEVHVRQIWKTKSKFELDQRLSSQARSRKRRPRDWRSSIRETSVKLSGCTMFVHQKHRLFASRPSFTQNDPDLINLPEKLIHLDPKKGKSGKQGQICELVYVVVVLILIKKFFIETLSKALNLSLEIACLYLLSKTFQAT